MAKAHGGVWQSAYADEYEKIVKVRTCKDDETIVADQGILTRADKAARRWSWLTETEKIVGEMWESENFLRKAAYSLKAIPRGVNPYWIYEHEKLKELKQKNFDPARWHKINPPDAKLCEHSYPFSETGDELFDVVPDEGIWSELRPLGNYFDTNMSMVDLWFRTYLACFELPPEVTPDNFLRMFVKFRGHGRECRCVTPIYFFQHFQFGIWTYPAGGGIQLGIETYFKVLKQNMVTLREWSDGDYDDVGMTKNCKHPWNLLECTDIVRERLNIFGYRKVIFGIIPMISKGIYVKDNETFWNQFFVDEVSAHYMLKVDV